MNRIKNLIAISAFSFLVMGLPAIASAQYGGQNDPYGRNGGYNNGGNRNNGYNGDIRGTLRDLKQRSNEFKRQIDRQGGGGIFGGYDNRNSDRYLRDLANNFKKAADRLEGRYNERDLYRSQSDAQQVLSLGSQLDQELNRGRSNNYLRNDWNQISRDLRIVASAYGNNYNGNRNGNGGWGNGRKPSWWPF